LVLKSDSELEELEELISGLDRLATLAHEIKYQFDETDYLDNSNADDANFSELVIMS
jgi:hypothetical protein